MKENLIELTDDEAYAIENGDGINDGIYSPNTYENHCIADFCMELERLLSGIGYHNYLVDKYEKAEGNLRTIETQIIGSIGKKSYDDIMDLLKLHRGWLERDIEESSEEYDDLSQYVKNLENNNITMGKKNTRNRIDHNEDT